MDSTRSLSFVSYRYDTLSWNPKRSAMMGIQAPATNKFYNYQGNVAKLHNATATNTSTTYLKFYLFSV